jgi:hypothetical protein
MIAPLLIGLVAAAFITAVRLLCLRELDHEVGNTRIVASDAQALAYVTAWCRAIRPDGMLCTEDVMA